MSVTGVESLLTDMSVYLTATRTLKERIEGLVSQLQTQDSDNEVLQEQLATELRTAERLHTVYQEKVKASDDWKYVVALGRVDESDEKQNTLQQELDALSAQHASTLADLENQLMYAQDALQELTQRLPQNEGGEKEATVETSDETVAKWRADFERVTATLDAQIASFDAQLKDMQAQQQSIEQQRVALEEENKVNKRAGRKNRGLLTELAKTAETLDANITRTMDSRQEVLVLRAKEEENFQAAVDSHSQSAQDPEVVDTEVPATADTEEVSQELLDAVAEAQKDVDGLQEQIDQASLSFEQEKQALVDSFSNNEEETPAVDTDALSETKLIWLDFLAASYKLIGATRKEIHEHASTGA